MTIVNGGPGNDTLPGTDLDDTIFGFGGNDTLIGGLGADILDGGEGTDWARYADSLAVDVSLATGLGIGGEAEGDQLIDIENLSGSLFGDTLTGDGVANVLIGRAGADTISGNDGDDWIKGGQDGDALDGGDGIDTVVYTRSSSGVAINLFANTASGGDAQGDTLANFENVVGSSHADTITGDDGDNRINGGAGNDQLFGLGGADVLIGGTGADLFDGGGGFDFVSYADATGNVAINLRNNQILGDAAGDQFVSIEGLVGTQFGDSLIMGDENNRIKGGGGNDFIDGGRGNDILIGGSGGDFLHGSVGIDTASYVGSDAAVQISLENFTAAGGHAQGDTLSSIHNIKGSKFNDTIEGDILENALRGHDGDDLLIGRSASDVLVGGAGADRFGYVDLSDHVSTTMDDSLALSTYAGSSHDTILDFVTGEDVLEFDGSVFSGPVFETNQIADLGLTSATDTAFAFTGGDLFYIAYADAADFANGIATVTHLAQLNGVGSLSGDDFVFV